MLHIPVPGVLTLLLARWGKLTALERSWVLEGVGVQTAAEQHIFRTIPPNSLPCSQLEP